MFASVYHVLPSLKYFFVCDAQHVFFIEISTTFLIVDEMEKIRNIYYFSCSTSEYSAKYLETYYQP